MIEKNKTLLVQGDIYDGMVKQDSTLTELRTQAPSLYPRVLFTGYTVVICRIRLREPQSCVE